MSTFSFFANFNVNLYGRTVFACLIKHYVHTHMFGYNINRVFNFARIACNRVHCTRTGEHGSPLHYFCNCISFIQFISIIVFVSLLSGRPMNAPTDTHILLYIIWSGNTDFHFAIHIPDHNFQLSIFNFQLNCVYQYTIILIQNYIRIKTFSSTWQAFFRHLYIRL